MSNAHVNRKTNSILKEHIDFIRYSFNCRNKILFSFVKNYYGYYYEVVLNKKKHLYWFDIDTNDQYSNLPIFFSENFNL